MKYFTSGTIISNQKVAENIYLMQLDTAQIATCAQPGQFINIYFNDLLKLFPRPFSIAGIADDSIKILYKIVGSQTTIMKGWKKQDQVKLLGPLGNTFIINQDLACAHILLGGGVGAAPLLFLADRLRRLQREVTFFLGFKTKSEIFSFNFDDPNKILLSTDDGSLGFTGNTLQHFNSYHSLYSPCTQVYSCGPELMMKAVVKFCNTHKINCQVSLETIMACGLGLCQGCAVKHRNSYKLVCKDGPVFDSKEIFTKS
jgi:dihydroorotate dehydrogenase electron transfer subunit